MKTYIAGMDGGGTKTAVTIADRNGHAVHTFRSGAINYNGQDEANIRSSFREIFGKIASICGGLEHCEQICIGAAGISNPTVAARLEANARQCGYQEGLLITGDYEAALRGAQDDDHGIIIIAGTGSICYGRNEQGYSHRTGGYGHLVDDEGSGYSIGRELISAVLKTNDGRSSRTVITDMVYDQLGLETVQQITGFVYDKRTSKKDIAALAPLLSAACVLGDPSALSIVEKSAASLFELIVPVAEKLSLQRGTLALSGSVLLNNSHIRDALSELVKQAYPYMDCITAKQDAAAGAILIALNHLNES